MAKAYFGGGCFWCLEAIFSRLWGVDRVVSGYAAGSIRNPTYEAVCSGSTGHAEVVAIDFSPDKISYHALLAVFFAIHDPTSLNRQGADVGTQYRSIILVENEEQRSAAKQYIQQISGQYPVPIVTAVETLDVFYPAEEYHQKYFELHPEQGYCAFVVAPKVLKFRERFFQSLKSEYR